MSVVRCTADDPLGGWTIEVPAALDTDVDGVPDSELEALAFEVDEERLRLAEAKVALGRLRTEWAGETRSNFRWGIEVIETEFMQLSAYGMGLDMLRKRLQPRLTALRLLVRAEQQAAIQKLKTEQRYEALGFTSNPPNKAKLLDKVAGAETLADAVPHLLRYLNDREIRTAFDRFYSA